MSKKITLEDLARMTAKGFESVNNKIDDVNDAVRKNSERVERGFHSVNARLDILEKDVKQIRETIHPGMTRKEYLEMDQRITIIEERLNIKY